jgi:hypothetical protein
MAYSAITKPSDYFNIVQYTGDLQDSDGTGHTQSITGVGFQPDFVWHKGASGARTHMLVDRVRGVSSYNFLATNSNAIETTANTNGAISSIDSDGITVQNGNDSSSKSNNAGKNGETYVTWNWLGAGSTSSNSSGNITTTVSANTTAGFSIVSWTGNAVTGSTHGHGLGVKPDWIVLKNRGPDVASWPVYHSGIDGTSSARKYLSLNNADGSTTSSSRWDNEEPGSTYFKTGSSGDVKGDSSGETFIAYCWASKKGFSKFGQYAGNGNADGTFVYTGFKPAWLMVKKINSGSDEWNMFDNVRDVDNVIQQRLVANVTAANASGTYVDFLSSGFKFRTTNNLGNGSGNTYIYMCFAENPFVANDSGTAVPVTAR